MKKTLIKSDVAGIVAEICFNKRDFVKEGENLIFIESMKMEIPVIAPFDSEIEEIFVKTKKNFINQGYQLIFIPSMRTPQKIIDKAQNFFDDDKIIIQDIDKKAYL